jgi:hypothetical protein
LPLWTKTIRRQKLPSNRIESIFYQTMHSKISLWVSHTNQLFVQCSSPSNSTAGWPDDLWPFRRAKTWDWPVCATILWISQLISPRFMLYDQTFSYQGDRYAICTLLPSDERGFLEDVSTARKKERCTWHQFVAADWMLYWRLMLGLIKSNNGTLLIKMRRPMPLLWLKMVSRSWCAR